MGAKIIFAGESNLGLARKRNEDNFILASLPGRASALAAVADGIGGHRDGDIASRSCCARLGIAYLDEMRSMRLADDAARFLRRVLGEVNSDLRRRSRAAQLALPMGSTVIAGVFFDRQQVLASSGDSRCYEYRSETGLRRLNTDHVATPELLAGMPRAAESCRLSGAPLVRAIGLRDRLEIDLAVLDRAPDSRYLFCSDGLYRGVKEETIRSILAGSETPRQAVGGLMRQALLAGGRDNITIIAAFPAEETERDHGTP